MLKALRKEFYQGLLKSRIRKKRLFRLFFIIKGLTLYRRWTHVIKETSKIPLTKETIKIQNVHSGVGLDFKKIKNQSPRISDAYVQGKSLSIVVNASLIRIVQDLIGKQIKISHSGKRWVFDTVVRRRIKKIFSRFASSRNSKLISSFSFIKSNSLMDNLIQRKNKKLLKSLGGRLSWELRKKRLEAINNRVTLCRIRFRRATVGRSKKHYKFKKTIKVVSKKHYNLAKYISTRSVYKGYTGKKACKKTYKLIRYIDSSTPLYRSLQQEFRRIGVGSWFFKKRCARSF